jgi:hypothetical protein
MRRLLSSERLSSDGLNPSLSRFGEKFRLGIER